ncbi:TPA: phage tail protein [Vibrio parahaemolyticus]
MANTTDKSILTAAGKALLAQLNAEEKPLIIDKMMFANVPNRPEFPQPDDVVPTDDIVHQEQVEQRGRLSADSVIYSTTLTSDVGPFEFNWTGAYCSEYGVLVTIDHHALTPKTADEPGVAGNTLVRSVVLEYKDIAEITNITVDASSWQYNATDRMKKMDSDVAQSIIDQNGKDWFIEYGFLVTPSGSAYNIKAGAGYVSGNRVSMEFDRSVQVPNKPSFIYIDAHREGTPTGEQVTLFDFVITAEEKDDYIDSSTGKDISHFVCKIAEVLADGSVSDLRPEAQGADKAWVTKTRAKSGGTTVDINQYQASVEKVIQTVGFDELGEGVEQFIRNEVLDDAAMSGQSAFVGDKFVAFDKAGSAFVKPKRNREDIRFFGAKAGRTDTAQARTTEAIRTAIQAGVNEIEVPHWGEFFCGGIDEAVSNFTLSGGQLITPDPMTPVLMLRGDNIHIRLRRICALEKPTAESLQYGIYGVYIIGDDTVIHGTEIENINGIGMTLAGRRPKLFGVKSHNNHSGARLTPQCRDFYIAGSNFFDNNILPEHYSGADGLLLHRNIARGTVVGCGFWGNSEHGVYGQGERLRLALSYAFNNKGSGFKFGSYSDQNFYHDDENIDPEDPEYHYIGKDNELSHCWTMSNGGSGLYIQPTFDDFRVRSFRGWNDNVRSVHFNDGREESLSQLSLIDVKLRGEAAKAWMSISSDDAPELKDIDIAGNFSTYASDAKGMVDDVALKSVKAKKITLSRSRRSKLRECEMDELVTPTNSWDADVKSCVINAQTVPMPRIKKLLDCDINYLGAQAINYDESTGVYSVPVECSENEIDAPNIVGQSLLFGSAWNVGSPDNGTFDRNILRTPNSKRCLKLDGTYNSVQGNTFVVAPDADYVIDASTVGATYTGNTANAGAINMRSGEATGNVVVGNGLTVIGDKVNNTVGLNKGDASIV